MSHEFVLWVEALYAEARRKRTRREYERAQREEFVLQIDLSQTSPDAHIEVAALLGRHRFDVLRKTFGGEE